jgi:peroxiredoxin
MSNQLPRKTNASARTPVKPEARSGRPPATNAPAAKSSRPGTQAPQSKTGSRGAQSNVRARAGSGRQQQSGFKLRNSDIAFLFVGLVLVAGLIWIVLASSNSGSTSTNNAAGTGATGSTGNAAGAPPASTNGSASGNAGKQPEETTPIAEGTPAPDFSLPDLNGKTYTLSQFKGKTVVLEFLATWCPHCQNDAPMMNKLNEAYKDKNVQMLGINASQFGHKYEDEKDTSPVTLDDLKWFHDTFTVTYPLLFDPVVKTGLEYGIKGYPTVYIVDKNGVVASRPAYPFTYEDLTAALDKALAQ